METDDRNKTVQLKEKTQLSASVLKNGHVDSRRVDFWMVYYHVGYNSNVKKKHMGIEKRMDFCAP